MGQEIPENHFNVKEVLNVLGLTDPDSGLKDSDVINLKLSSDLKVGIS